SVVCERFSRDLRIFPVRAHVATALSPGIDTREKPANVIAYRRSPRGGKTGTTATCAMGLKQPPGATSDGACWLIAQTQKVYAAPYVPHSTQKTEQFRRVQWTDGQQR